MPLCNKLLHCSSKVMSWVTNNNCHNNCMIYMNMFMYENFGVNEEFTSDKRKFWICNVKLFVREKSPNIEVVVVRNYLASMRYRFTPPMACKGVDTTGLQKTVHPGALPWVWLWRGFYIESSSNFLRASNEKSWEQRTNYSERETEKKGIENSHRAPILYVQVFISSS